MSTRVLCVRHGQSMDNVIDLLSAVEPGCALSAHGREQAADLAEVLRSEDVAHVYTSPLRRARETAGIIAATRRLPVTLAPGLREMSLGSLEGVTADATEVTDDAIFRAWLTGDELARTFRGGERGTALVARMRSALDYIADQNAGRSVVAVSHSGAMLAGLANICANLPEGPLALPPNCGVVTLVRDRDWECVDWTAVQVGSPPAEP